MKMLLTTLLAVSIAALGACSSNEKRGDDIGRESEPATSAQSPACLPPNCAGTTVRPAGRTATSAKPTVKLRH